MRSWIACAALLFVAPIFAADPPCPKCDATCPATNGQMMVKVFAVADLVVPIPNFTLPTVPGSVMTAPVPVMASPPVAQQRYAVDLVRRAVPPPPMVAPPAVASRTIAVAAQPAPPVAYAGGFRTVRGHALAPAPAMPTEDVPPGAVRVVRAESPTAVLIGGLQACEPAQSTCVEPPCRVAVGEGLRINVPALGPAPIQLDCALGCAASPLPATPCAPCHAITGDKLVKLLTTTVRPYSWQCAGGTGRIEYFEIGNSLVVHNSPDVVREVEAMLGGLRTAQEQSIVVECRLVSVPVEFFERVGVDFTAVKTETGPAAFLNEGQVRHMLEAVQGHRHASVLMAPKMTMYNGQTGSMSCDCETKTLTTGLDVRAANGSTVTVPKQETIALGTTVQVQPTMSADRRHVRLAFAVRQAELKEPVQLMPVTSMVTPVFEGGSQGQPIPFTQFIQQPNVVRRTAERTVTLPDGGSVAVPVGKRMIEVRSEFGPPVLSQVPYINRLFKNVGIGREQHEVIAVLTARVVTPTDVKPCAATECQLPGAVSSVKPCCDSEAARLVTAYQKACAEGRTEEAMKLAMKALAADPTCFAGKK